MERSVVDYTPGERLALGIVGFVGLAGLNGVFMYGLLVRPDLISGVLANPVALAFVVEALVLTGVLAYLLGKWGVSRIHWAWFVVLSLAGGIAFALPVVILATARRR